MSNLSQVEVEIGGQRIDRQYGDWMHIWNQLTLYKSSKKRIPQDGWTNYSTYLLTDPDFADVDGLWCNASQSKYVLHVTHFQRQLFTSLSSSGSVATPDLRFPLLHFSTTKSKSTSRSVLSMSAFRCQGSSRDRICQPKVPTPTLNLLSPLLSTSITFSSTPMSADAWPRTPTSTLLSNFSSLVTSPSVLLPTKIKLNFNHPCKELVWVVQPDLHVAYCDSFISSTTLHRALGAQPFNYTDALDALPNTILAFGSTAQSVGTANVIDTSGLFTDGMPGTAAGSAVAADSQTGLDTASGSAVSDAGVFVLAETALNMHCWGENPVVTAKLQLNGQDRFSEREGTYFDLVQPFQHHTRNPDTGINLFSFALRPEEHQPSGTCNFSRIDNATLQLVVSAAAIGGVQTAKVRVYATNYNVLRIMSGMGGLAYSN